MNVTPLSFGNLRVLPFVTGFLENNIYALYDEAEKDCVVIDPSFNMDRVLPVLAERGLAPREFWLTHGHFDHFIGIGDPNTCALGIPTRMHPKDEPLFHDGGKELRMPMRLVSRCPEPVMDLAEGLELKVGAYSLIVMETPGHSPGHCCFYCKEAGWLFSGDLVFWHSCGRTDLMGGSEVQLLESIRTKVLTLPDETIVLPGHNDYTTVGDEKRFY